MGHPNLRQLLVEHHSADGHGISWRGKMPDSGSSLVSLCHYHPHRKSDCAQLAYLPLPQHPAVALDLCSPLHTLRSFSSGEGAAAKNTRPRTRSAEHTSELQSH